MMDKDFLTDIEEQLAIAEIVEKGLAGRKWSRKWQKQLAAFVALVVIGLSIFGVAFSGLTRHIPMIEGIFSRMDGREANGYASLSEQVTSVVKTQYANGFSITLSESFFDGERIYLIYLVEGDKDFANEGHITFNHSEIRIVFDDIEITEILSTPEVYPGVDNHSQIVVLSIATPYDRLIDVKTVEVIFNISQLVEANVDQDRVVAYGPWNFRVPIVNTGSD